MNAHIRRPIPTISDSGRHVLADDQAVFTISAAADMLGVTPRTLRLYEKDGLIVPSRHGKWRFYSLDNLKWLSCLRQMVHEHGISIAAIKKLLQYTPCWNIAGCPFEKRKQCSAFLSSGLVPKKLDPPSLPGAGTTMTA
ncbi:MAG: MerR family transcriptional regulator [Thermodesulfobacteriota bacterium]